MLINIVKNNSQKGNVLFLILIAVALFAALSYAVTNSTRSTGNSEKEANKTKAAEILQHANSIQIAMQRLSVMNGCNYDAIAFNDAFGDPADYPGPCNIFDTVNGGGVAYNQYPDDTDEIFSDIANPAYPGKKIRFYNTMKFIDIGIDGRSDATVYYFNIDEGLCKAMNEIAKISGPIMQETTPYEGGWLNPIPSAVSNPSSLTHGEAATNIAGKSFGCFKADRSGTDMGYHIYYVLIEH